MSAKIQIRRLKMLDYARGFAILCMMFFHSFQFYEGDLHQVAQNMSSNPIQSIFKFFGRWAGLFVMISGTAFAYVNSQRLNEGKTKPKTLIKQTIGFGVILILVERITRLFFARTARGGGAYGFDDGPVHYSIVVGCVETGSFQKPNLYAVVYKMGAVTAIAFSLITLSCFISLFYREGETKISSLEFYVLGLLGSFFVLYSGFFVEKFRHAWVEYMKNGNVFMALFSGAFVGDIHALFPLLGYAFYGAMFGLAFTNESPRRKVVSIAGLVGLFYVLVGTHYYAEMGEPQLEDMYQTTPIQTTFLQVGMMIWVLCLVFWVDSKHNKEKLERTLKPRYFWKLLNRLSKASLTVYLLEGTVGSLIKVLILDQIFPGWARSMAWVVIYDLLLIILWNYALKHWEKHDLKYSFEWTLKKLK